jgi:hypothetical protein
MLNFFLSSSIENMISDTMKKYIQESKGKSIAELESSRLKKIGLNKDRPFMNLEKLSE